MSWKDEDEVTTTYGTIQNVKQENYIAGFYDGVAERRSGNTAYTDGFKAGQRDERERILSFVEAHEGIPINVRDIVNEINHRYKKEQDEIIQGMNLLPTGKYTKSWRS
jgi:hypothetical protein